MKVPDASQVKTLAKEIDVSEEDAYSVIMSLSEIDPPRTFFDVSWKPMLILLVANMAILVIFSVFYTNRIAGPIYRIRNTLQDRISGETYKPVTLRKGDAFKDVADLLNKLLSK